MADVPEAEKPTTDKTGAVVGPPGLCIVGSSSTGTTHWDPVSE
jgi:hypothetical protein